MVFLSTFLIFDFSMQREGDRGIARITQENPTSLWTVCGRQLTLALGKFFPVLNQNLSSSCLKY